MQQIFKVTNVGAIEQITSKKDGSTTRQQRAEKANLVGAFATNATQVTIVGAFASNATQRKATILAGNI